MTPRGHCAVCKSYHRTQNRRVSALKWMPLCASCQTALAQIKSWQQANPTLDVTDLVRVFQQYAPKPAAGVQAPPREKTA